MKHILITTLLTFGVLAASAVVSDSTKKNAPLPSISLKNIDGESVDIASYGKNGKITVISFWATWCKPCIKELRNVDALLEDWEEEYGVELVAVSLDDAQSVNKVKSFANGQGWTFDILLDPNGELRLAMNVTNPPVTFLVDEDGNIVYTHTGYLEGDEIDLEDHIKELHALKSNTQDETETPKVEEEKETSDHNKKKKKNKKKNK
jgi:peroxiredoxin